MRVLWCALFVTVPLMSIGFFVAAPWMNWWLPENLSTIAGDIDRMFYVILAITGAIFALTQGILIYALIKYGKEDSKPVYFHENTKLELVWSIIPAGILVFLAFYQLPTWGKAKYVTQIEDNPNARFVAVVVGTQFDWRVRYVGPDGQPGKAGVDDDQDGRVDNWEEIGFPETDDVETVAELHLPANELVVIRLTSNDVLHSFFVPQFRIKQDAVPGMLIPVWFQATEPGEYELACAELCGWGHYRMRGKLVIQPRDEFQQWLKQVNAEEEAAR